MHTMRGWAISRTVLVGAAATVFIACSLLPTGWLLTTALSAHEGEFDVVSLDARQRGLLSNTAFLGIGTAALSSLIGIPLGFALARTHLPRAAMLRLALAAPILLPPYVAGLAWIHLGGRRGLVAAISGVDLLSEWTYTLPGAIVVLSLVFYPLSMLATEVALRRIDGRLEEAGVMVAPPLRVLWRITLPMAAPGPLAAALVIFVLAISEFGVPGLLQVRVYTTEVFTAFAALYDFGRALRLTVPLLLLCIGVAAAAVAVLGDRFVTANRTAGTPPLRFEEWRRPAAVLVIVVLAAALGLPLVVLAREAAGARSLTTVVAGSGEALARSLVMAAAGATAIVAVAVWLGYARARAGRSLGHLADIVFLVAFAIPSTIVGVGLIGLWNRPGIPGAVYGTDVMFVLAYLARFVPVAALALAAGFGNVPPAQEEAAAVAGAGWLRSMRRIVLPQVRPALAAAWVVAFVLAFGELGASILVAPPGEATLPIRVYTLIANAPPSQVAILALLQTAVVFVPMAILGAVLAFREAA